MLRRLRTPLLVLTVFLCGLAYGYLAHRDKLFPYGLRRDSTKDIGHSPLRHNVRLWTRARETVSSPKEPEEHSEELSRLAALAYLSGYKRAPSAEGVVVYDRKATYDGYNFYTSGHAPGAVLMDMEGKILHTWAYELRRVWPERATTDRTRGWWRRAHLFPNGEVLAIFDYHGLIKLDRDSNLLWRHAGGAHHDLQVTSDGRIYVLASQFKANPFVRKDKPIIEEFISVLSGNGELLKRISIVDAFANSKYASLLDRIPSGDDILHTNTIEVLDGTLERRSKSFKAGNVLISVRNIDVIAVMDIELGKVVWALTGMWKKQHQPTVLKSGTILLFDNEGNRGHSRVIEFDPFTQKRIWKYAGKQPSDFSSSLLGSNHRLGNGNTLITESTFGRAFEVTADQKIVWEFINPRRAGEKNELIAVISDMLRIEPRFPLGWLKERRVRR